jgi:hypothetical protein
VILQDLPEYLRESIDAYIGCVAGALKKADYLKAIKSAGFTKVKVLKEEVYPLDLFLDDEAAKLIMADLKITPEQAKELTASVVSVKVEGIKPV